MSDHSNKPTDDTLGEAPVHGLLAEYESPKAIIAAAKKVRDAGFEFVGVAGDEQHLDVGTAGADGGATTAWPA